MYGLPGSPIQFGTKRSKKKPGRKSSQAQFLEKQTDLFEKEKYVAALDAKFPFLAAFKPSASDAQR